MLTTSDICCDPRHALLFSCSGKHKASVTTTLPPQRKLNVSRDALPLTASNYSSNPWTHTKNDQHHRILSFSSYPQSYPERHPQTIFFSDPTFCLFSSGDLALAVAADEACDDGRGRLSQTLGSQAASAFIWSTQQTALPEVVSKQQISALEGPIPLQRCHVIFFGQKCGFSTRLAAFANSLWSDKSY